MPDADLQATALRYAAGELAPGEAAAFEARLAGEQAARDALAEAVRLSARAIGQEPPAPRPSVRAALRERLSFHAYRGGPLAWTGLGAAAVAACTLVGLSVAGRDGPAAGGSPRPAADVRPAPPANAREDAAALTPPPADPGVLVAVEHPPPAACGDEPHPSVAEIWADLSSHEGVEKAHDDEFRRRQRVRDLGSPHVSATAHAAASGVRER